MLCFTKHRKDMLQERLMILMSFCSKFIGVLYVSIIIPLQNVLTKLLQKESGAVFFAPQCMYMCKLRGLILDNAFQCRMHTNHCSELVMKRFHCHRYIILLHDPCNGFWDLLYVWNHNHWSFRWTFLMLFPIVLRCRSGLQLTFLKPWRTLKGLLVHQTDKQKQEDITECVYTRFSCIADLLCSDRLAVCWPPVKARLVLSSL